MLWHHLINLRNEKNQRAPFWSTCAGEVSALKWSASMLPSLNITVSQPSHLKRQSSQRMGVSRTERTHLVSLGAMQLLLRA